MRVTISFTDTLASLLVQYANKSNLSLAAVVRLALSEFFERQRLPQPTAFREKIRWEDEPKLESFKTPDLADSDVKFFEGVYLPILDDNNES